jgi:hypothetical protein
MKMTKLDKISGPLRQLLSEREIIARCELLLRIYDIVNRADLNDHESEELTKLVGERIAPGIFANIMSGESIFFDLPKLDTYTQMNGHIFHFLHTQRYSKQDFGNANSKFLQSLPELKRILSSGLAAMLKDFMENAGYSLTQERAECLVFSAGERIAEVHIATSIRSVDLGSINESKTEAENIIILVPSSESLEPFMQFYREKGSEAEEKEIQIWLASLEKSTIDPFIGYTTDLDIYKQFKNPRLAEMVRNNWGKKA